MFLHLLSKNYLKAFLRFVKTSMFIIPILPVNHTWIQFKCLPSNLFSGDYWFKDITVAWRMSFCRFSCWSHSNYLNRGSWMKYYLLDQLCILVPLNGFQNLYRKASPCYLAHFMHLLHLASNLKVTCFDVWEGHLTSSFLVSIIQAISSV